MSIFSFDIDEIVKLKEEGKKFFFEVESEQAITKLLEIQAQVEQALKEVKEEVVRQGLEASENFTGVKSEKIRCGYRFFGSSYGVDVSTIEKLPETMYSKNVRYNANTKEVEAWAKEHDGKLPLGITRTERVKQATLGLVSGGSDDE